MGRLGLVKSVTYLINFMANNLGELLYFKVTISFALLLFSYVGQPRDSPLTDHTVSSHGVLKILLSTPWSSTLVIPLQHDLVQEYFVHFK